MLLPDELLPVVPEILVVPDVRVAEEPDLVSVEALRVPAMDALRVPDAVGANDDPMEEFIVALPLRPCTEPWLPLNTCWP